MRSDAEFYRSKAQEHAGILSQQDAQLGSLDLGCGAGELLEHLAGMIKVELGVDYSASMLSAARARLAKFPDLKLVRPDVLQYLPSAGQAVWMTTGAANQYLDAVGLERLLDGFRDNAAARSFYLFDCIDPIRYRLLRFGISYRAEHGAPLSGLRRIAHAYRRLRAALRFAAEGDLHGVQYLGSPQMGYGQLPRFWLRECERRRLSVEIVSSRYYEYRYHVRIMKGTADAAQRVSDMGDSRMSPMLCAVPARVVAGSVLRGPRAGTRRWSTQRRRSSAC